MFNTLIFLAFLCREQPPSGGCVLKQLNLKQYYRTTLQPPSGGCVLKPVFIGHNVTSFDAAAFGRLCVETLPFLHLKIHSFAAAFGRLCVETSTIKRSILPKWGQPPSGGCVLKLLSWHYPCYRTDAAAFGRLCVETIHADQKARAFRAAAFGRLCVETKQHQKLLRKCKSSRRRAAVC